MNVRFKIKQQWIVLLFSFFVTIAISAQVGGWKADLVEDSETALNNMIDNAPKLQSFKDKSYGYVVYPKITKAGFVIGGAGGKGIVFKNHNIVGESSLKQGTFGLQAGGQQYSEVIFFEDKSAYDHFTNGHLKFNAQASAVAIKAGVSIDVAYKNGVAVFTRVKGGLMYEASVGGQHFTYKSK